MQKVNKRNYETVVAANTFIIIVVCNVCDSTNCFIGVSDKGYEVVCANCGHVEACV